MRRSQRRWGTTAWTRRRGGRGPRRRTLGFATGFGGRRRKQGTSVGGIACGSGGCGSMCVAELPAAGVEL